VDCLAGRRRDHLACAGDGLVMIAAMNAAVKQYGELQAKDIVQLQTPHNRRHTSAALGTAK
jgi:hypothetical protein